MSEIKYFKVTVNPGLRIDKVLSLAFPDMSRSYLQKLIKDGQVSVNGNKIKSNYKVSLHDEIAINIPELAPLEIVPEPMNLDILYEDADVILINKGKNVVVHPAAGHTNGTLVNGLLYHCKDQLSGINGVMRPGIVHRIDRNTTEGLTQAYGWLLSDGTAVFQYRYAKDSFGVMYVAPELGGGLYQTNGL